MSTDITSALQSLLQALKLMGDAVTGIVGWIFQLVGLNVPDYVLRVIIILSMGAVLLKFGSKLSEIIILIIIAFLIATVLGFQLPWSSHI